MLYRYLLLIFFVGCSVANNSNSVKYPLNKEEKELRRVGKLSTPMTYIFRGSSKNHDSPSGKKYVWNASLSVLHNVPISTLDPHSGSIITEWYKSKDDRRSKINIFVPESDKIDDLKLRVYSQDIIKSGLNSDIYRDYAAEDELRSQIKKSLRALLLL